MNRSSRNGCWLLIPLVAFSIPLAMAAESAETVYYGETARVRGFDPLKAGDIPTINAVTKVYEGLYQYAYLDRPYRVEPNLAEGMPEISPDGLTWTIRIRTGIRFSADPCWGSGEALGRELEAADVIYSILRVADQKNRSTGYWAFRNRIVGLDEFRAVSSTMVRGSPYPAVAGLQAPQRHVVQIRLLQACPQLIWILTLPYAFIVPREAVEYYGDDFLNHPVGTGPYRLQSWRQNYRMEFVRNPVWRLTQRMEHYPVTGEPGDAQRGLLADAGQPIPFIDRIVQYVINDSSTQWLMFLQGHLESSGISRDNWDAVMTPSSTLDADLSARGIEVSSVPALDTYYIGFNMEDPVVGTNKALRQALSCALNTAEWIRFYGQRVCRASGPIPPGLPEYRAESSPFEFDMEKARHLLVQAGYPEGRDPRTGRRLQLTLDLGSTDTETREAVELLVDFMARVGVEWRANYSNKPNFFRRIERRQAQMFWLNWAADYPDAENFLQLFYGPNSSPGANRSNYRNPAFDRLYEQARALPEGQARNERYRAMADLVIEDCPWIFLHHPMAYSLYHSWLKNVKPHDFPYGMIKYYRIDNIARAAGHSP